MIDQTEIRIGVSIGCAFGPIDGATVDDLILKADLALYEAKGAGRGVAKYFSSELQTEQDDRVRLETDLRQAIAAKQFHLVFQPLVSAKTQKLVGFEALIRWNHPQRGFVPPNVFIPVAEESGLDGRDRRMGDRRGLPRRRHLAGADHRRAQHQPEADHPAGPAQHRQPGAVALQVARQPAGAGSHRGRVPGRQRPDVSTC